MYIQPFQFTQPSRAVYNSAGIKSESSQPKISPGQNYQLFRRLFAIFEDQDQHIGIDGNGLKYLTTLQRHYLGKPDEIEQRKSLQEIVDAFNQEFGLEITLQTTDELKNYGAKVADATEAYWLKHNKGAHDKFITENIDLRDF